MDGNKIKVFVYELVYCLFSYDLQTSRNVLIKYFIVYFPIIGRSHINHILILFNFYSYFTLSKILE